MTFNVHEILIAPRQCIVPCWLKPFVPSFSLSLQPSIGLSLGFLTDVVNRFCVQGALVHHAPCGGPTMHMGDLCPMRFGRWKAHVQHVGLVLAAAVSSRSQTLTKVRAFKTCKKNAAATVAPKKPFGMLAEGLADWLTTILVHRSRAFCERSLPKSACCFVRAYK